MTTTELSQNTSNTPAVSIRRGLRGPALGLIVVFITQLMLVVDASIVNVALPDIQKELHFSPTDLSWVVTAYALAFGGLILLSGKIGSIVGARLALIVGVAVFIVASAMGGFAPTPEVLVAARVLQGVGAAIAAPSTLVLLVENTTEGQNRARAMSLFVLAAGSGGAIGLILGGFLTTSFGWEWVMFVNVPIGILIIAGAALFLRETKRVPAKLDVGGAAVSTIGMVALVYAFTRAASHGWTDPQTLISFAVAIVALVGLIFIERRHSSPVVQLHFFSSMRTATPLLGMLLVPAGMFGFFYFAALFTQHVLGFDPLGTGLALLPFVAAMLVTNEIAPRFLPRIGEKVVGVAGLSGMVIGLVWLGQMNAASTFWSGILGPAIVLGISAGLTFAPLTSIAMAQAPKDEVSAASSLLQGMQQLGGSIGVAVLTTVFVGVTAISGEARGISTSLLIGAAFPAAALVLFAIWGRRIPATAGDEEGAAPVVLH
ncbi:MFS transporter [Leifsonia poae]|uniref:MFS transporter n=1 Tax=Leifsonia poae TaxID=110933 RepID=A0A9W6H5Y1_9MICO|nr:MFS transporter [Leifsonia poae]GLJ74540.1 MFS transporter [Leifsonia poae]